MNILEPLGIIRKHSLGNTRNHSGLENKKGMFFKTPLYLLCENGNNAVPDYFVFLIPIFMFGRKRRLLSVA